MLYICGDYVPLNCDKGLKFCYIAAKRQNDYGIVSVICICENELVKMSNKTRWRSLKKCAA